MQYFNPDKVDTSDFNMRDISADELVGMKDCANHTLSMDNIHCGVSKHEKKLARYLLKAVAWMEREAYGTIKLKELIMSKGLFAKNSMGKKIVTCHSCGFQTLWGNYVDWDSIFECSLCSPTKQARMISKAFVQVGCTTGRITTSEPTFKVVSKDVKVAEQPITDLSRSDKDVHTEHCCSIHGCKYGEDVPFRHLPRKQCSVTTRLKKQSYPCESCSWIKSEYPDSPRYEMQNGEAVLVDKGKEKKELLDKIRQFLWNVEHTDTYLFSKDYDKGMLCLVPEYTDIAHELRVEFDKVFGETK